MTMNLALSVECVDMREMLENADGVQGIDQLVGGSTVKSRRLAVLDKRCFFKMRLARWHSCDWLKKRVWSLDP